MLPRTLAQRSRSAFQDLGSLRAARIYFSAGARSRNKSKAAANYCLGSDAVSTMKRPHSRVSTHKLLLRPGPAEGYTLEIAFLPWALKITTANSFFVITFSLHFLRFRLGAPTRGQCVINSQQNYHVCVAPYNSRSRGNSFFLMNQNSVWECTTGKTK